MEIIPAVDLMNGEVVRLVRGDPKIRRNYRHLGDPLSVALKWSQEGADLIHVVDLDAALGLGSNLESVRKIIGALEVPVQVGGGIRSLSAARGLLEDGAQRVILGSMAFERPETVELLIREYGSDRIVVALDHLKGEVLVRGWKAAARLKIGEALTKFFGMGVRLFLVTSVSQDGTMKGPDIETLSRIRNSHPDAHLIAAGGVKGIDDIVALKRVGVHGVIIGTALYEGHLTLRDALKVDGR